MAYFVSSMVATGVADQFHDNRARAEAARWFSPLGRLGRCGILSLRVRKALDDTLRQAYEAAAQDGRVANDVRFADLSLPIVVVAGGEAASSSR